MSEQGPQEEEETASLSHTPDQWPGWQTILCRAPEEEKERERVTIGTTGYRTPLLPEY